MKGVGEVEGWLVRLMGPIVNGIGTRPGTEAAVGKLTRFASFVDDINKALGS